MDRWTDRQTDGRTDSSDIDIVLFEVDDFTKGLLDTHTHTQLRCVFICLSVCVCVYNGSVYNIRVIVDDTNDDVNPFSLDFQLQWRIASVHKIRQTRCHPTCCGVESV